MNRLRLLRVFLAVVVSVSVVFTGPDALAQTKGDVERTEEERNQAFERLQEVSGQLEEAVRAYQAVTSELEDLTWRIAQLYSRIQDYEAEARDLRDQARELVLEAYMNGGGELVRVAFEAGSIQDILTSQELINRATDKDLITLDRLDAIRREMDRLKAELEVDQARVAELRDEAERIVEELDVLYAKVDAEYRAADAAAREAKRKYDEEVRKQRLLELARKQGASGGVGDNVTPGFRCPVPTASFINDWGFARSGGRTHKGTDLFAGRGTATIAVADGTVRLKTNSLGGIVAFLNADHGVTYYYAHLDGYAPGLATGSRVTGGQTIGYVGTSGNAYGSPPHLHFEMHPGGGAAVNPYPTLSRHC